VDARGVMGQVCRTRLFARRSPEVITNAAPLKKVASYQVLQSCAGYRSPRHPPGAKSVVLDVWRRRVGAVSSDPAPDHMPSLCNLKIVQASGRYRARRRPVSMATLGTGIVRARALPPDYRDVVGFAHVARAPLGQPPATAPGVLHEYTACILHCHSRPGLARQRG
jgi:hypothetical protein